MLVGLKHISSWNNISEYLDFAIKIAKEAGSIQMKYFGNISSLEKNPLVSICLPKQI